MKFIKSQDLKLGMILAKPIYNKKGVLLFERGSKLTNQGIEAVNNYGLLGIYVLDPAEPLPPISEEDIEFEKFQSVMVFNIMDELREIAKTGKAKNISRIAQNIIKNYGHLDHKINFIQNLRSNTDFVYKHALNTAMLCAILSNKMNIKPSDQEVLVTAALVHVIGYLGPDEKNNPSVIPEDVEAAKRCEFDSIYVVENVFSSTPAIKRIIQQTYQETDKFYYDGKGSNTKIVDMTKIMIVANDFDKHTAMNFTGALPKSEIEVLRHLMDHPEYYDRRVVDALLNSVNFLNEGVCVELSNGDRALVINSNPTDVLRPVVLCFKTNKILDLAQTLFYGAIEIVDVVRDIDNRHVVDTAMLEKFK